MKKVSSRCKVYAENYWLEECVKEFSGMEEQLKIAEEYLFPCPLQEYGVIVLPKSFPFGGMENPLITCVSPTLIVGDGS